MISFTRNRCCQATLITGHLGSGKTWTLTDKLLRLAKDDSSSDIHHGTLLALVPTGGFGCLQEQVDLKRPLGCRRCDIATFQGLVQSIVHDFGPTLGSYSGNKRALDRVELSVFLHRHLDKLPLGKYTPVHSQGDAVRPLLGLFSSLAHCGVEPDVYLRYTESLETGVELADEKQQIYEECTRVASREKKRIRLQAIAWKDYISSERDKASAYKAYEELKQQEGVEDYGDRILLARRILRESTLARAELSLRLAHVFVDDLQDYSPAMMDIMKSLVSSGVEITATADPSLEAWSTGRHDRNAFGPDCSPLVLFKEVFPEVVEVPLDGSRGRADAIVQVMSMLMPCEKDPTLRGLWSAELRPPTEPNDPGSTTSAKQNGARGSARDRTGMSEDTDECGTITCSTFDDEDQEMADLVRRIRELISRGVNPKDIGVVALGSNAQGPLLAALHAGGIPVDVRDRSSNVFEHDTPRMLMSLLRCLVHPSESVPLLDLLMSCPAYALPSGELAAALEGHMSRYVPLRVFLRNLHLGADNSKGGISDDVRAVAGKLLSDLDRYGEFARSNGVRGVMLAFMRDTGQLQRLEDPETLEDEKEGHAVATLFNAVVMAEKQAGGDTVAIVEPILRLFRRHGMGYVSKNNNRMEDIAATELSEGSDHAVRVVGIRDILYISHDPFQSVFIPFCKRSLLPGPLQAARLPLPGPFRGAPEPRDTASIRVCDTLSRLCHENRARSMLYAVVASGRQHVFFSVAAGVTRGKYQLSPSPFLSEIFGELPEAWKGRTSRGGQAQGPRTEIHKFRSPQVVLAAASAAASQVAAATFHAHAKGEGSKNKAAPEPLRLSFSSINSYGICPHNYYLQHVLQVTPSPSPRMVYGKAMHEAVARCLRATELDTQGPLPPLEVALEEFNRHFVGCAFESPSQVRALTEKGVAGLESFLWRLRQSRQQLSVKESGDIDSADNDLSLRPRVLVEQKFRIRVSESRVILSGVFDRIDVIPGADEHSPAQRLSITDYKSNVGKKKPECMVRDSLQLRLYSLAGERLFGVKPAEVVIESVEDGRRGVAVPDRTDVELALEAISTCATGVRAKHFDATPAFQSCMFCGFRNTCQYSVARNTIL